MSIIHIHLYRVTRRQIRDIQANQGANQEDNNKKSVLRGEGKVIRMFAGITLTYAIVWSPYFVVIIYKNLTTTVIPWLDFIGFWFVISGSWCDAAIIAGMSSAFRKTARRLMYRIVCLRNRRTEPIMSESSTNTRKQVTQMDLINT